MHSIFALHMHGTKNCKKWIWHSFVFVTTPIDSFVQELALPKACHDTKVYGWKRRRMALDWWLITTASLCLSCVCVCLSACSMLALWQHVCFPRLTSKRADNTVALRYLYANVKGGDGGSHRYDCWMICWMITSWCQHFAKWQSKAHKWWTSMSKSSHPKPDTLFFSLETKMHSLSADGVRESDSQDRAGRLYFDGCCMVWSNGKLLAQGARAPDYTDHSAHCSSWPWIVLWRCFIAVTRACTDEAFDKSTR